MDKYSGVANILAFGFSVSSAFLQLAYDLESKILSHRVSF